MDLISVIVPIYNVEKYLDKCIESIINQTHKNLEIILVDDGSIDQCPQICDNWAEKDLRIKVIHQENAGGGAARNRGLEIAKGDYISFIDSDDYISPFMYEILLSNFEENIDIVECDIVYTYDNNADLNYDIEKYKFDICNVEQALQLHIQDKLFCQTPPNKLYRSSVIDDVRFPVGKRIDDEFWTYKVIANSKKLIHIYAPMYAYRQQSDSIMHKQFSLERLQALDAKEQRLDYIKRYYPKLLNEAKANFWYTCLFLGQMSLDNLSKYERKYAMDKINSLREFWIVDDITSFSFKNKIWFLISRISFKTACILRNYINIGK